MLKTNLYLKDSDIWDVNRLDLNSRDLVGTMLGLEKIGRYYVHPQQVDTLLGNLVMRDQTADQDAITEKFTGWGHAYGLGNTWCAFVRVSLVAFGKQVRYAMTGEWKARRYDAGQDYLVNHLASKGYTIVKQGYKLPNQTQNTLFGKILNEGSESYEFNVMKHEEEQTPIEYPISHAPVKMACIDEEAKQPAVEEFDTPLDFDDIDNALRQADRRLTPTKIGLPDTFTIRGMDYKSTGRNGNLRYYGDFTSMSKISRLDYAKKAYSSDTIYEVDLSKSAIYCFAQRYNISELIEMIDNDTLIVRDANYEKSKKALYSNFFMAFSRRTKQQDRQYAMVRFFRLLGIDFRNLECWDRIQRDILSKFGDDLIESYNSLFTNEKRILEYAYKHNTLVCHDAVYTTCYHGVVDILAKHNLPYSIEKWTRKTGMTEWIKTPVSVFDCMFA